MNHQHVLTRVSYFALAGYHICTGCGGICGDEEIAVVGDLGHQSERYFMLQFYCTSKCLAERYPPQGYC